jgi:hypothetical protein
MHSRARIDTSSAGFTSEAELPSESLAALPDWLLKELTFGSNDAPLRGKVIRKVPVTQSDDGAGLDIGTPTYRIAISRLERVGVDYLSDRGVKVAIDLDPVDGSAYLEWNISNPDYRHRPSSGDFPQTHRTIELDMTQVASLQAFNMQPVQQ